MLVMRSALALRHVAHEDLDGFEPALHATGYRVEYRDAWNGGEPIRALEPDLLIVLGAPVSVYETEDHPFIGDELAAVQARLDASRPVLGVCFGAQMIARAAGSRVYPGEEFEFGWHPLNLTAAGDTSPVRHYGGFGRAAFHCHGDTFDLPSGATLLASTPAYRNQAFALGPHLGIQFHGEVTARGLERWFIGHAGRIRAAMGQKELAAQTARWAPTQEHWLLNFIAEWLGTAGQGNQ